MEFCLDETVCFGLKLASGQLPETQLVNPLFQWELQDIWLNGTPGVYVVNSAIRYRAFLYPAPVGKMEQLQALTCAGIQTQMLEDGFPPEWVEQYFRLAGEPCAVYLCCHRQEAEVEHLLALLSPKGVQEALQSGRLRSQLNHPLPCSEEQAGAFGESRYRMQEWVRKPGEPLAAEESDVCLRFRMELQKLLEREGLLEKSV